MVCGAKLVYETHAVDKLCGYCGKTFPATVYCPDGHYVCEDCHGEGFYALLEKVALETDSRNPMVIAEQLLKSELLPSLGGEHHGIVVAALLAAARNYGESISGLPGLKKITDDDIREGIRRMRQIPGCSCAYHGACGAGLGVGAFVSILYDATCAKDVERTLAMRATNAALTGIANAGGPGCCKQSVRIAILVGVEMLKELTRVKLPVSHERCFHIKDTSHGCKGSYCQFVR